MSGAADRVDRLRVLVDAGIAMSSELSLDALLQRIVESAAELTGAKYAALGVVDRSGMGLERFFTTGVSPETHAAIGELPRGRGLLGAVIREARPVRLHEIADDPRSAGFPHDHPRMHTFLGVPILTRGVVYGNLYLSEKADGSDFTDEDEDLTQLLAAQAAVAIDNARLYESSSRWLRQLESLHEIGNALAEELELEPLLGIVAALRVAAAAGEDADELVGMTLPLTASKVGKVLERGRSERVDSVLDDPEVDQAAVRRLGVTTALYVPLGVRGRAVGVVAAHDKLGADTRFGDDDVRLAESLAARAAIALALSERVSRDAVRRVVEGQELERKRLARELHDETGQALTSILLGLKSLELAVVEEDREAVADLRELVVSTLQDVRRLAVELRPAALDDFGLAPALERLVETHRARDEVAIDVEIGLAASERLPAEVETTVYRIVQEALTNVARHADAARISILVARKNDSVVAVIEDDGSGFDPVGVGDDSLGLAGIRERVALLGGRLRLESAPGKGTTLAAEVPLR